MCFFEVTVIFLHLCLKCLCLNALAVFVLKLCLINCHCVWEKMTVRPECQPRCFRETEITVPQYQPPRFNTDWNLRSVQIILKSFSTFPTGSSALHLIYRNCDLQSIQIILNLSHILGFSTFTLHWFFRDGDHRPVQIILKSLS